MVCKSIVKLPPLSGFVLGRGGFVFGGEWMKTSGYLGVRNDLILDPKHREKIGPALFLFLYLMANADYETGKLDRKIGTISDDMGKVPKRTVEHWIGILKKGKYIKSSGRLNQKTPFESARPDQWSQRRTPCRR